MAPPCYADLGKDARDLFNRSYHYGVVKLECKTKTPTGVDFTVNGNSTNETGRVAGSLETKYKISDYGATLKAKWNTDNTLFMDVCMEDQLVKGMKLSFDSSFAPQSGKKSGTLKGAYKMDHVHLNSDIDMQYTGPIVHGAGVINYQGWLAGAQLSFDTGRSKLTKSNFAVGYSAPDFVLHTNVNDGQEFGGSVYQKVNDKLETGVLLSWTAGSNATRFGLGCIYKLDSDSSLRAKINNSSQVGLSFSHKLRKGVQLTLSTMIEGKNFNQGGHKLGLGLELDA